MAEKTAQDGDNKKNNSCIPPEISSGATPQEKNISCAGGKKHKEKSEPLKAIKITDWIMAIATVGIFVFNCLLWSVADKQTNISNRQTDISDTLRMLTDSSVHLNRQYVNAYVEATHVENRAYLTVVGFDILDFEYGKQPYCNWAIENTGKTPAHHVKIGRQFLHGTGLYEHEFEWMKKVIPDSGFTIGAEAQFPEYDSSGYILYTPLLNTFKSKERHLYFIGTVVYEDIFNQRHFTHFGATYDVDLHKTIFTKEWNDAD